MEEAIIKVDLQNLKKLIKQAEEQADQLQKTLEEVKELLQAIGSSKEQNEKDIVINFFKGIAEVVSTHSSSL